MLGFHVPALTNTTSLRFEYTRTAAIQYRHGLFVDGFTLDQKIMGSDLGPDAHGARAVFIQEFPLKFGYRVELDWDLRRSNIHAQRPDPDGTLGDIIVVEHRPADQRYRLKTSAWYQVNKKITLKAVLGYEYVINANYVSGKNCNDFLVGFGMKFNFGDQFKMGKYKKKKTLN